MRAYDILTDTDQRATYDQLLAIALQPPATPATRTYETVRKVASNTMAASVILAVLVGGYTVFGLFSKPPGAAEMLTDRTDGGAWRLPRAPCRSRSEEPLRRDADARPARRSPWLPRRLPQRSQRHPSAASNCARLRQLQSGKPVLSALRGRLFRPRRRALPDGDFRSPADRRHRGQAGGGSEADQDRGAGAAQAVDDRA